MSQQKIKITQDFPMPVDQLFDYLGEHENLAAIFAPTKVTRVCDGDTSRNGVGSVRKLQILIAPPFYETVTKCEPNELVEYKITKGSPLKNHLGVMKFQSTDKGSRLDWTITFEGKLPLIASVVGPGLGTTIRKGLKQLSKSPPVSA
ncbi:MAG: SRPBCC family protein [Thermoleophilaceae bacterium]|nr:SRPBCC family protein [Thermoleophilaceae bacterium]